MDNGSRNGSFNPRPASGAKSFVFYAVFDVFWFQSAPRERGEMTFAGCRRNTKRRFNPRPASGAKFRHVARQDCVNAVSIRAPRAGRNQPATDHLTEKASFNPRPASGAK